ncbi:hypothetical protein GCM10011491_16380 [Brucella endophytica]|uniref:PIN domain-containing protein n=1 Tax=Brucella endophytica TaxID=1963359 RepID=A0A916SAU8_9HYPH|nr:PIN domain-containing protein [Brucella endophytica]GGA89238.1 hypothetical protein GCM10011491_16380 [Brucella endophytica]
MEPTERLYLDTNVFIEMAEGKNDWRRRFYKTADVRTPSGAPILCTSEFTLAELLVLPYREGNDELIQLYENWIMQGSVWLDVMPVTQDVLRRAALVRCHYPRVKLPDAIHLSTAISFGCSHFLSADKKIPNEIEIANLRFETPKSSQSLKIVTLSSDILQSILSDRA